MNQAFHTANLTEVVTFIWSLLHVGVREARDAFHTPALATQGEDGPEVRTVVLRHADPESREISCHTDWRSVKRRQVEANPRVSWLFYHPQLKVQLRCSGDVTLHRDDELAEARWTASAHHSRCCYATPLAPGTPVGSPPPAPRDPEGGRQNFSVLACRLDLMDWLFLCAPGHRRAVLRWRGDSWGGGWVAP